MNNNLGIYYASIFSDNYQNYYLSGQKTKTKRIKVNY